MRPSGLCRSQNHGMHAGADETQPGRHILKVGIPCRTTGIRKVWAARGETITPTMCKQHTGGAMERKDQRELTTDGRSVGCLADLRKINLFRTCSVLTVC